MPNREVATIDFETRSAANLRACGSWRYSCDPTTQILCLAWRLPWWEEGRTALWHPEFANLAIPESDLDEDVEELCDWITAENPVEAHNAWFERGIWTNILAPQYGWPQITHRQWRCSAAKAAAHALPRQLDKAAAALRLKYRKDPEGMKKMKESAIKRMFKPRKPRKAEREAWAKAHGTAPMPLLWWEDLASLEGMWAYCRLDVLAEDALSQAVPDLLPSEHDLYLLDQAMNERGYGLDSEGVDIALQMLADESVRMNAELAVVTDGLVKKATQREKMLDWFDGNGLHLPDTQKATLDDTMQRGDLEPHVRRALELMRALGRSSTAKYKAMRQWVCPDGRAHGGLLFHGASTGRWSGAGVQPQNFVRGSVKDMEGLWVAIKTRDPQAVRDFIPDPKKPKPFGDLMTGLSQALRGAIIPRVGNQLYVADYANIEARVLLWLAKDEDGLDLFRRKEDIYCDMASSIYGYACHKDTHPNERQLGKVAILGLGYQMGPGKFETTAYVMGGITITSELAEQTVTAYREKYWRVKQMWYDQEEAAIAAMGSRGRIVRCGRVAWVRELGYLYCILPSGRRLAYPSPEVRMRQTPWGAEKPQLTFMGINPYTRKWERQSTYGGMLVENQTQAVARDLMADAMTSCEQDGTYEIVLSVHDELIAEAPLGVGSVQAFEGLLTRVPTWAKGCPVDAEGWRGVRYRK